MYENILIPLPTEKEVYNIACNLKEAYETNSKALVKAFESRSCLHTIDEDWNEHLRELMNCGNLLQNASYEQKDPFTDLQVGSFKSFPEMINDVNSKAVSIPHEGPDTVQDPAGVRLGAPEQKTDYSRYRTQKDDTESLAPGRGAK